jgi:hypothetical protein
MFMSLCACVASLATVSCACVRVLCGCACVLFGMCTGVVLCVTVLRGRVCSLLCVSELSDFVLCSLCVSIWNWNFVCVVWCMVGKIGYFTVTRTRTRNYRYPKFWVWIRV